MRRIALIVLIVSALAVPSLAAATAAPTPDAPPQGLAPDAPPKSFKLKQNPKPDKPKHHKRRLSDMELILEDDEDEADVVEPYIPPPVPTTEDGGNVVVVVPEGDEDVDEAPVVPVVQNETPEQSVGEALTVAIEAVEPRGPDRAGYCAPVPMLRTGDGSYGIFMDLYADDASRALYHSLGFTDAIRDPVTDSIYCA